MPKRKRGADKPTNKPVQLPQFESEEAERVFWQQVDTVERMDWSEAKRVRFPDLKASPE